MKITIMEIVSYNVRGLRGTVKKKELSHLIRKNNLDMIFIQEIKMENMENKLCVNLRG